jgi:ubiquinone/menaquinone biosynthesis C-methylase UbiE
MLDTLVRRDAVIDKKGIYVTKEIAENTVWDKLAKENPTHAVISAKDSIAAAEKSKAQIADIKKHVSDTTVLLDLGAGYGRVAEYLLPQQTLGGYVAVDSAYEMLSIFKRRYETTPAEMRTPVLFVNADIHTLPLQNQTVDVVIVCAVFLHNHKEVVSRAMAEVTRVLKSGGTILVYSSFPRAATGMGIQGYAYQALLNLLGKPYKNGPVRYYRAKEIRRLLKDFKSVSLVPFGFGIIPKSIIFLPKAIDTMYRTVVANPLNRLLERVCPTTLKKYFATHYDVVATR